MIITRLVTLLANVDVSAGELEIPQGDVTQTTFQTGLQIVFGIAGAIALLVITLAGLKYIISQGNPQETAKAKNTILYALVGLVISILSFSIVTFVVTRI